MGKSGIRFKRLEDLDLKELAKLVKRSHKLKGPSEVASKAPPKKR